MTITDIAVDEDGDIYFDSGGDIGEVTNVDALKQQTVFDVHEVVDEFELRSDRVALKNLETSIEERLRQRGYNEFVSFDVRSVDGTEVTILGEIDEDEQWEFTVNG